MRKKNLGGFLRKFVEYSERILLKDGKVI